jgi:hypothetical protein
MAERTDKEPQITYNKQPVTQEIFFQLRRQEMNLKSGWFGRIFGDAENAPTNTASMGIFAILILTAILCLFNPSQMMEILKIMTPILTLIMGYLFGRRS